MILPVALGAALLAGYLLGSIPTSVIVGKVFFKKDLRDFGSGNAGGTNTFRTFGWKAGVFVSAFDLFKGFAAARLAVLFGTLVIEGGGFLPPWAPVAEVFALVGGTAAVIGHVWTIFAGFRGGKGVACAGGLFLLAAPVSFGITLLVFILVLGISGIVSLTSITSALTFTLSITALWLFGDSIGIPLLIFAWILGFFIFWTHRANIGRLFRKEEKRFEKVRFIGRLFDRG